MIERIIVFSFWLVSCFEEAILPLRIAATILSNLVIGSLCWLLVGVLYPVNALLSLFGARR